MNCWSPFEVQGNHWIAWGVGAAIHFSQALTAGASKVTRTISLTELPSLTSGPQALFTATSSQEAEQLLRISVVRVTTSPSFGIVYLLVRLLNGNGALLICRETELFKWLQSAKASDPPTFFVGVPLVTPEGHSAPTIHQRDYGPSLSLLADDSIEVKDSRATALKSKSTAIGMVAAGGSTCIDIAICLGNSACCFRVVLDRKKDGPVRALAVFVVLIPVKEREKQGRTVDRVMEARWLSRIPSSSTKGRGLFSRPATFAAIVEVGNAAGRGPTSLHLETFVIPCDVDVAKPYSTIRPESGPWALDCIPAVRPYLHVIPQRSALDRTEAAGAPTPTATELLPGMKTIPLPEVEASAKDWLCFQTTEGLSVVTAEGALAQYSVSKREGEVKEVTVLQLGEEVVKSTPEPSTPPTEPLSARRRDTRGTTNQSWTFFFLTQQSILQVSMEAKSTVPIGSLRGGGGKPILSFQELASIQLPNAAVPWTMVVTKDRCWVSWASQAVAQCPPEKLLYWDTKVTLQGTVDPFQPVQVPEEVASPSRGIKVPDSPASSPFGRIVAVSGHDPATTPIVATMSGAAAFFSIWDMKAEGEIPGASPLMRIPLSSAATKPGLAEPDQPEYPSIYYRLPLHCTQTVLVVRSLARVELYQENVEIAAAETQTSCATLVASLNLTSLVNPGSGNSEPRGRFGSLEVTSISVIGSSVVDRCDRAEVTLCLSLTDRMEGGAVFVLLSLVGLAGDLDDEEENNPGPGDSTTRPWLFVPHVQDVFWAGPVAWPSFCVVDETLYYWVGDTLQEHALLKASHAFGGKGTGVSSFEPLFTWSFGNSYKPVRGPSSGPTLRSTPTDGGNEDTIHQWRGVINMCVAQAPGQGQSSGWGFNSIYPCAVILTSFSNGTVVSLQVRERVVVSRDEVELEFPVRNFLVPQSLGSRGSHQATGVVSVVMETVNQTYYAYTPVASTVADSKMAGPQRLKIEPAAGARLSIDAFTPIIAVFIDAREKERLHALTQAGTIWLTSAT